MDFDGKHITLEKRKIIEENIFNRVRKYITAIEINKSPSAVGKEIGKNRKKDILLMMIHLGCANIIMSTKFV